MFGLGFSEIIFLAVLALIVIGPKQLPEVARTIGRFINDIKRNTDFLKDDIKAKVQQDLDIRKQQVQSDMLNKKQVETQKRQEELKSLEEKQGLPAAEEDRKV